MLTLDVQLGGDWEALEALREAVRAALCTQGASDEFCGQLAMVAGELVENAIKHGNWSARASRPEAYRLLLEVTAADVTVRVRQPAVGAGPKRLFDALNRIHQADSAESEYAARMREVARSLTPGGLGLPRIAHEAGCLIFAEVDDQGILEVRALAPLPARAKGR